MRRGLAAAGAVSGVLGDAEARLRAAGVATARQDAELLLARVLGTTRLALRLEARGPLSARAQAAFETLLARREGQEPLQYILGEAEFCGLPIAVGAGVFIPRPETELLVERALAACPAEGGVALDLCAGSGAVACALAARHPRVSVWAVERSAVAANWARENVRRLGLAARVWILEGDLFAPVAAALGLTGRCDLVVANPPYIARPELASLPDEVGRWEPPEALDGGPDGTAVIARILRDAADVLRPGGTLLVEIGHDQAPRIRAWLAADPRYERVEVHRDWRGHPRLLEARRA